MAAMCLICKAELDPTGNHRKAGTEFDGGDGVVGVRWRLRRERLAACAVRGRSIPAEKSQTRKAEGHQTDRRGLGRGDRIVEESVSAGGIRKVYQAAIFNHQRGVARRIAGVGRGGGERVQQRAGG